jgi:glycosyltransferase involved in cell wall biosynthesis
LNIGIDYTPAYEQGGGIGRYVRELIDALVNENTGNDEAEYRLFVAGYRPDKPLSLFTQTGSRVLWRTSRIPPVWYARIWHRARLPLPVQLWTGRLDLFHATDFTLPPTLPKTRTLLTVHDLSFVRVPESASPRLKRYLDSVVPRSVRRADHILADSQATKDDLVELYGTSPEKITVLLSGVNPRFVPMTAGLDTVRTKYGIGDDPFVLCVGTVQPRKNYERVIRAIATIPDVKLVIVGGRGWLESPIYAAVDELHMRDRVIFTGFADEHDLPALYSAARVVAFPSLYEGFGLPILEGFACGTPVLTAPVSSLTEVAGDAALLVDPLSVEAIRDGLIRLIHDESLRAELIAKGRARAALFTWQRAAQELKRVYAQMVH